MSKLFSNPNLTVKDFNPEEYVKDYINETTGEVLKRLPFNAQLMWFRLRYPEGKVSVTTRNGDKGIIIAKAKLYADRHDAVDAFIAEGESSRGVVADMPSINPRNWAQTAAIATALRYAGFGLEYDLAGDEPEAVTAEWDALMDVNSPTGSENGKKKVFAVDDNGEVTESTTSASPIAEAPNYDEMSSEEAVSVAGRTVCPKGKYAGKTISEILVENKSYCNYVLKNFDENDPLYKASKVLVDAAQRFAE